MCKQVLIHTFNDNIMELNTEFSTEESLMAQKHLTTCSMSLLIMEIKTKKTLGVFYLTSIKRAKLKTQMTS